MLFRILALLGMANFLFAADKLNTGDTAWMLISTALVLFMTPAGLAMFYTGMTRAKNAVNTSAMVVGAFVIGFSAWIIAGYSLAFSSGNGFIGGLSNILLHGISWKELSGTYPTYVFVAFQGMFAAITIAIAAGSAIERMKYSTWLIFSFLWVIIVYAPIAHMIWGGGFLMDRGALDFAGGTVVHMNGGLAGLVLAILLGKRKGYGKIAFKPMSVMLTSLGAAILWFGWFGFNAGSAFGANEIAGLALLTTAFAPAIAAITWIILEYIVYKKMTLLGLASGIVAGLVGITPAAGFVDMIGSIIIGLGSSIIAFWGVVWLKKKFGYDDALDAFGVHFLAGLYGALAVAFLAVKDPDLLWDSPLKATGSRMAQFLVQLESVVIVGIYTAVATAIVYFISALITKGARVDEETETEGLDEAIHGERAINL